MGAKLAWFAVLFQNGKATVPYVELTILLGFLVLVFA